MYALYWKTQVHSRGGKASMMLRTNPWPKPSEQVQLYTYALYWRHKTTQNGENKLANGASSSCGPKIMCIDEALILACPGMYVRMTLGDQVS